MLGMNARTGQPLAGMADSAEFILRVRADWTPGCDALKEAVDARRHKVRQ